MTARFVVMPSVSRAFLLAVGKKARARFAQTSAPIANCTVNENTSGFPTAWGGGGICILGRNTTISDCNIIANLAERGGGIYSHGGGGIVTNCIITDNVAEERGGGIFNSSAYDHNYNLSIDNCLIAHNLAGLYGSALCCTDNGIADISNSAIVANYNFSMFPEFVRYGVVCVENDSELSIKNCTITGNVPKGFCCYDEQGYTIGCINNSSLNIENSICWNSPASFHDEIGEIFLRDNSSTHIRYSDIRNGQEGVDIDPGCILDWGTGNINADPCFVDSGYWDPNGTPDDWEDDFWLDGDYRLLPDSPCIDTGDPNYIPIPGETDLDGNPRIVNGIVDMGAYELPLSDPLELLEMLAEDVSGLGLHKGIETSLLAKLNTAIKKLQDDNEKNDVAAEKALQAFINAVQAQSGKKIPESDADALITAAQQILDLLTG